MSDTSDVAVRPIRPRRDSAKILRLRQSSPLKSLAIVAASIVTIGSAGSFAFNIIAWPWERREEAADAHRKLDEKIDLLSRQILVGLDALPEKLEERMKERDRRERDRERRR
jgi:hypothetical protein